jgi:hypothetical protein
MATPLENLAGIHLHWMSRDDSVNQSWAQINETHQVLKQHGWEEGYHG